MRTAELAIGTHVAYNRGSRSYPNFTEAYVFAHRPKGNRYTYYGTNHNTETVAIAYQLPWQVKSGAWEFDWVRPGQLEMPWAEYAETQAAIAKRKAERDLAFKKSKANNRKRMAAIPADVKALFSDYQLENAITNNRPTVTLTVELLEKLVEAAQKAHPKVKAATVEEEVAAALALLG